MLIDTVQLHQRITERAKDYVHELFAERYKATGKDRWRVGRHGSLKVSIADERLVFFSYEDGTGGDAVALWQRERGGTVGEALRAVAAWAGIAPTSTSSSDSAETPKSGSCPATAGTGGGQGRAATEVPLPAANGPGLPVANGPQLPKDATPGTEVDWRALAALRHVSAEAVYAATLLGTLLFGTVCGRRCWILTDARRCIAEARRMDGQPFPATEYLGERKAHTLKGSVKSWPVGLWTAAFVPAPDAPFLIVEGGPDYLAALHFAMRGQPECLPWHPIAFLGAGTAREIHPEAMALLRGRRARFYPHHEASGAGARAADQWAAQLAATGAITDAFRFADLRRADGAAVKDLNDCTRIHPDQAGELEGLLP